MSGYWSKSLFERGWVTLSANFKGNGASPTNDCWRQKTRFTGLSYGVVFNFAWSYVYPFWYNTGVLQTDAQTDGWTVDTRWQTASTALEWRRAGKNGTNNSIKNYDNHNGEYHGGEWTAQVCDRLRSSMFYVSVELLNGQFCAISNAITPFELKQKLFDGFVYQPSWWSVATWVQTWTNHSQLLSPDGVNVVTLTFPTSPNWHE